MTHIAYLLALGREFEPLRGHTKENQKFVILFFVCNKEGFAKPQNFPTGGQSPTSDNRPG